MPCIFRYKNYSRHEYLSPCILNCYRKCQEFGSMCFIQLFAETFDLSIEGTMNEQIDEIFNSQLEVEDE
jgi:hypothetical protein